MRPGHPLPTEAQCLLSSGSLKPKRQSRESYSREVKVHVRSCNTKIALCESPLILTFVWSLKIELGEGFSTKLTIKTRKRPPPRKTIVFQLWPNPNRAGELLFPFPPFLPTLPNFVDHLLFWEAINLFLAQFNLKHNNTPALALASPQITHGKYIREPVPVTQLTKAYGIIDGLHWDKMNMEKVEHLVVVLNQYLFCNRVAYSRVVTDNLIIHRVQVCHISDLSIRMKSLKISVKTFPFVIVTSCSSSGVPLERVQPSITSLEI